jgi:hypothetical protein
MEFRVGFQMTSIKLCQLLANSLSCHICFCHTTPNPPPYLLTPYYDITFKNLNSNSTCSPAKKCSINHFISISNITKLYHILQFNEIENYSYFATNRLVGRMSRGTLYCHEKLKTVKFRDEQTERWIKC